MLQTNPSVDDEWNQVKEGWVGCQPVRQIVERHSQYLHQPLRAKSSQGLVEPSDCQEGIEDAEEPPPVFSCRRGFLVWGGLGDEKKDEDDDEEVGEVDREEGEPEQQ